MPDHDFTSTRIFVAAALAEGAEIALDREASNHVVGVLRMAVGEGLLVFNGRDGEWRARIAGADRKGARLAVVERTRPQPPLPDLHYLFAPLKHARLDYVVQKAVEMGAGALRPVLTQHTQVRRVNTERMRANVTEAAQQCGVLAIPSVAEPVDLAPLLAGWAPSEGGRHIVFCDEAAAGADVVACLRGLPSGPLAVLIGPEGGFSAAERKQLLAAAFVTAVPLGPRILRADTAAVAALALVQAVAGDWR